MPTKHPVSITNSDDLDAASMLVVTSWFGDEIFFYDEQAPFQGIYSLIND
jgi:hypothetical protein